MPERTQNSITREQFYDEEIAPALANLRDKCADAGLNMLAVVEWDTVDNGGEWPNFGSTFARRDPSLVDPGSLQMSDLLFGLWQLAKRGFLCQSITTLKVVRDGSAELHTMIERQ